MWDESCLLMNVHCKEGKERERKKPMCLSQTLGGVTSVASDSSLVLIILFNTCFQTHLSFFLVDYIFLLRLLKKLLLVASIHANLLLFTYAPIRAFVRLSASSRALFRQDVLIEVLSCLYQLTVLHAICFLLTTVQELQSEYDMAS